MGKPDQGSAAAEGARRAVETEMIEEVRIRPDWFEGI